MEKVLITGGTGFIGSYLKTLLEKNNFESIILTSSKSKAKQENHFFWNYKTEDFDAQALQGVKYVIHLAGAGIADQKWSVKRKKEIIDSRVLTANFLLKKINELGLHLKAFISASGVGAYGFQISNHVFKEEDQVNQDFISQVTFQWENASKNFKEVADRVVMVRTPLVLGANSKALKKINLPIKLGLGSALASGKQKFPWVSIEDLAQFYLFALQKSTCDGVFNVCAEETPSNSEVTKLLARIQKKKILLPNIPEFILKLMLGEMSKLVTTGVECDVSKSESIGFKYQYPKIESYLKQVLRE